MYFYTKTVQSLVRDHGVQGEASARARHDHKVQDGNHQSSERPRSGRQRGGNFRNELK